MVSFLNARPSAWNTPFPIVTIITGPCDVITMTGPSLLQSTLRHLQSYKPVVSYGSR